MASLEGFQWSDGDENLDRDEGKEVEVNTESSWGMWLRRE